MAGKKIKIPLLKMFVVVLILFWAGTMYYFQIPCPIKTLLGGIECPSCGMTRAVFSCLKLDFMQAFSYNFMFWAIPFIGLYSACATMAQALGIAAIFIDNKLANNIVAGTCTHFSSAERQYRFPLELGNQRPPTAQWTITGGGACVISQNPSRVKISAVTFGKVTDYGIADVNNMGAAMAPAACSTIIEHLKNTNHKVKDYDLIATV